MEQRADADLRAEATVKVEVDGELLHTAADGNGPVNALDAALRKALRAFYPLLDAVHLYDYKVRILDSGAATGARTRVTIEFDRRVARMVDHGLRHEHHRGLGDRPRRLARVRDLEERRGAPAPRRATLHDRDLRRGEPMTPSKATETSSDTTSDSTPRST